MDRYRLKNVIIWILLLANGFLLGALIYRGTAARSAHERAAEQLTALFAADGIALDPDAISEKTPPSGRSLTRDATLDRKAAVFLLGKGLSYYDQGGGISSYTSQAGAALFRENGSFEAAGTLALSGEAACRDFCREFHYQDPEGQLDKEGSGVLTAVRQCDGLPVFNCTVAFALQQGVLVSVNGTLLPDAYVETADAEPLSAAAALTAFQIQRRETGAVASSVSDMYLCFELQSTAAPLTLAPAWCIVTDTINYYVNCYTGTVRQS